MNGNGRSGAAANDDVDADDNRPEFVFLDETRSPSSVFKHPDFEKNMISIAFVGCAGSGKTSILGRIAWDSFGDTRPTIGVDFLMKRLLCRNGMRIKLQLYDIAGSDRYRTNSFSALLCRADAAVLVFDLTSDESFKGLGAWKKRLDEDMKYGYVCSLAGNKCDKLSEQSASSELAAKIEKRAAELECDKRYYLTSAKRNINCGQLIYDLCMAVMDQRRKAGPAEPVVDLRARRGPDQRNRSACCGK